MNTLEIGAMVAALVLMFAVVGVKILTAQFIAHAKLQIGRELKAKQDSARQLNSVKEQKVVIENVKATLLSKKTKLIKKLARLQAEMEQTKQDEQVRKKRSEMRKV